MSTKTEVECIGTVELFRFRIYPIDKSKGFEIGNEVYVSSGLYSILRDENANVWWEMNGFKNKRGFEEIDHGLYLVHEEDGPTDIATSVDSQIFTTEGWIGFLHSGVCTEGHPDQTLRVTLWEDS